MAPGWTSDNRPLSKRLEHRLREKFNKVEGGSGTEYCCGEEGGYGSNIGIHRKNLPHLMFFLLPLAGISDAPNRVEQSAGRWQRLDYKWTEGDRARQGKSVPVHCASVCPCVLVVFFLLSVVEERKAPLLKQCWQQLTFLKMVVLLHVFVDRS